MNNMKKTNRTNTVLAGVAFLLLMLASAQLNAQLTLSKAVSTSTPNVNVPFTYTINYANPSITTSLANAVITDVIPAEINYVPGSIIGSNPAHITSTNYNSSTRTLTITLVNPLPAGSSGTLEFSAAFPTTTYTNTTASNKATSTSGSGPSTSNTVVVTAQNGVTPPVYSDNLQCGMNANSVVATGGGFNWVINWGNLSSSTASNFEMVVTIPPQLAPAQLALGVIPGTNQTYSIYYKTTSVNTWTLFSFSSGLNTGVGGYYGISSVLAPGEYFTEFKWDMGTIPGNGAFYYLKPGAVYPGLVGSVLSTDRNGNPVLGNSTIPLCANLNAIINGVPKSSQCCYDQTVSPTPINEPNVSKSVVNPQAGYLKGDIITYSIWCGTSPTSSANWVRPVVIDLLPPELEYNGNLVYAYQGSSVAGMGTPTFTQITNYNNTGQTLLK
jgi:fimbrial isopeptide formation D2 family protein